MRNDAQLVAKARELATWLAVTRANSEQIQDQIEAALRDVAREAIHGPVKDEPDAPERRSPRIDAALREVADARKEYVVDLEILEYDGRKRIEALEKALREILEAMSLRAYDIGTSQRNDRVVAALNAGRPLLREKT